MGKVNWDLVEHCKRSFELVDLLNQLDYHLHGKRKQKIFCPFHEDVNKKSAVIYPDDNVVYCFTERETYGPYDYLRYIDGMSEDEIKEHSGYEGQEYERETEEIPNKVFDKLKELKAKMIEKGSVESYSGCVLECLLDKEDFFILHKLRAKNGC